MHKCHKWRWWSTSCRSCCCSSSIATLQVWVTIISWPMSLRWYSSSSSNDTSSMTMQFVRRFRLTRRRLKRRVSSRKGLRKWRRIGVINLQKNKAMKNLLILPMIALVAFSSCKNNQKSTDKSAARGGKRKRLRRQLMKLQSPLIRQRLSNRSSKSTFQSISLSMRRICFCVSNELLVLVNVQCTKSMCT